MSKEDIIIKIKTNPSSYNINNEFNDEFSKNKLKENGRYQYLKAYFKCNCFLTYDSDVSEYSMIYYTYAWDFLYNTQFKIQKQYNNENKKQIVISDNEFYRGDTLNSLKTPFNHFVTEYINSDYMKKKLGNEIDIRFTNSDHKRLTTYYFDELFSEENLNNVSYSRKILDQFEKFAVLSATIGNQFPCPLNFNAKRGFGNKNDFPDLLLMVIYDYYNSTTEDEANNALKKLNINNCETKNWLKKFKSEDSFTNFVEKNYFQDFIRYNQKGEMEPYPLWEGHSLNNFRLPDIGEMFIEYLDFINNKIPERGKKIKAKAKENIK